jgi:hypothetical protein
MLSLNREKAAAMRLFNLRHNDHYRGPSPRTWIHMAARPLFLRNVLALFPIDFAQNAQHAADKHLAAAHDEQPHARRLRRLLKKQHAAADVAQRNDDVARDPQNLAGFMDHKPVVPELDHPMPMMFIRLKLLKLHEMMADNKSAPFVTQRGLPAQEPASFYKKVRFISLPAPSFMNQSHEPLTKRTHTAVIFRYRQILLLNGNLFGYDESNSYGKGVFYEKNRRLTYQREGDYTLTLLHYGRNPIEFQNQKIHFLL